MAPGPLREAAGFSYQEFSNLQGAAPAQGRSLQGRRGEQRLGLGGIPCSGERPGAGLLRPSRLGRYPAVTRNAFGKGTLTYDGTLPSDALQERILGDTLGVAGVSLADSALPAGIQVRHGVLRNGRAAHFYLNFSREPREVTYSYGDGTELLSGGAAVKSGKITLAPWKVAIVEEK